MTAATATRRAPSARRARPGRAVLRAETRLFLREPSAIFGIVAFPPLLLVVIGLVPPFREPNPDIGGLRVVDLYVPVSVLISVIMGAMQAMPQVITAYRQNKVLRRVGTTPARPVHLLAAQLSLHGVAIAISAVLVLLVGRLAYGVALPANLPAYVLGALLALASSLAIGALLSGVISSPRVATVVGSVVFVPSMFSAGVWIPVAGMPDWLANTVSALPLGASAMALDAAAAGDWPGPVHLLVAAAWAAGLTFAAARYFRWE